MARGNLGRSVAEEARGEADGHEDEEEGAAEDGGLEDEVGEGRPARVAEEFWSGLG